MQSLRISPSTSMTNNYSSTTPAELLAETVVLRIAEILLYDCLMTYTDSPSLTPEQVRLQEKDMEKLKKQHEAERQRFEWQVRWERHHVWRQRTAVRLLCMSVDSLFLFFAQRLANLAGSRRFHNDALRANGEFRSRLLADVSRSNFVVYCSRLLSNTHTEYSGPRGIEGHIMKKHALSSKSKFNFVMECRSMHHSLSRVLSTMDGCRPNPPPVKCDHRRKKRSRPLWGVAFTIVELSLHATRLHDDVTIPMTTSSPRIDLVDPTGAVEVLAAICRGPRKDLRRLAARALGALGWNGHVEVEQ